MKKVFLAIAAVIILLLSVRAAFVNPSKVEIPSEKRKQFVPIRAQRADNGKIITDPEQWDSNRSFVTIYVVIE